MPPNPSFGEKKDTADRGDQAGLLDYRPAETAPIIHRFQASHTKPPLARATTIGTPSSASWGFIFKKRRTGSQWGIQFGMRGDIWKLVCGKYGTLCDGMAQKNFLCRWHWETNAQSPPQSSLLQVPSKVDRVLVSRFWEF